MLAHILSALYFYDVMSYNLLTIPLQRNGMVTISKTGEQMPPLHVPEDTHSQGLLEPKLVKKRINRVFLNCILTHYNFGAYSIYHS